jgi:hypothetical protein
MAKVKHTIIYQSHFELMNQLTDEQAGILIKAIGLFGLGEEPKISDSVVMGIWMAIKRDFIIQSDNYQKRVNANKINGLAGGRPKLSNPNNPMGFSETQPNPQNHKDKDKDKDKDKVITRSGRSGSEIIDAETFDKEFANI